MYISVSTSISTHMYMSHTRTHTCAHRVRSTACALENVLGLLGFAYDSTTTAASGIARSNRLQSTEGESHTVKSYL